MTIRDQVVAARARLIAAQIAPDEAARDASLLARHALGCDAASLVSRELDPSPAGFTVTFDGLIERRTRREPVAYIRGVQEFWGREFAVSPAVLIPRPETELIVEETLQRVARGAIVRNACDVGTGSGCLAVTLAIEMPSCRFLATDVSAIALEQARVNADRHDVSSHVEFLLGDYLADASGPFDLIVSNPPYIAERDYTTLPPEVHDFEPGTALVAGIDGLRDIRELVRLAPAVLRDDGFVIFEIGHDQSARVTAMVSGTPGLRLLHIRADLQGHARVAVVQKSERHKGKSGERPLPDSSDSTVK